MTEMLTVTGVHKAFADCVVLRGVDFAVKAGECVALCGENGAGKSTLLRILMGLETLDKGSFRTPAGIGMVHQHFSLVPALTVAENIWLGAEPTRFGMFDSARARAETLRLAHSIGWAVPPDARVETLTVGERQRVEVLKALRSGAQLLLLDEPTATLTAPETAAFLETLKGLAARGTSIVFVSHKLQEVATLCSRAVVLRRGLVTGEFSAQDRDAIASAMIGEADPLPSRVAHTHSTQPKLAIGATRLAATHMGSVLADATFTVNQGEILGVAGVDGNGQDALFAALAGTAECSGTLSGLSGSVADRRQQGLRVVPADRHHDALLEKRSVAENLALGHRGVPSNAQALLTQWDVRPPDLQKEASELSGGNQQKLMFAREMDPGAAIIVVHEPTRGVDWYAKERIWHALREATARGAAVVVISSDYDELKALSDSLVVLYRGKTSAQIPRAEINDAQVGQAMGGLA